MNEMDENSCTIELQQIDKISHLNTKLTFDRRKPPSYVMSRKFQNPNKLKLRASM